LRQVDFDGAFELSKTIVLEFNSTIASQLAIYPNPTHGEVKIFLSNKMRTNAQIGLTDISGKEMVSLQSTGSESILDLQKIPAGIYLLKVETSTELFVEQLIKK